MALLREETYYISKNLQEQNSRNCYQKLLTENEIKSLHTYILHGHLYINKFRLQMHSHSLLVVFKITFIQSFYRQLDNFPNLLPDLVPDAPQLLVCSPSWTNQFLRLSDPTSLQLDTNFQCR